MCIVTGCELPANPKSKKGYCKECGKKAFAAWKQKISESNNARVERDANFQTLFEKADAAGKQAVQALIESKQIVPMVVEQRQNVLDDNSPVVQSWFVPDGVCGFAWITIQPGNSPLANYAKKHNIGKYSDYNKGVLIWVHDYGQSMQKKEAYAKAYAKVLRDAGFNVHYSSKMD